MPRGDKSQMMAYYMPRFNSTAKTLAREARQVLELVAINERQAETLGRLRDALLPKLISGKIDVSEVKLL